ncbi:MAG TPA: aldo/keto reductase [Anaerolineales bacterium]|nr:aldo/keto reductase [Anaerolineales bacterium]
MNPEHTLTLPRMGVGVWSWGDRLYWGYDRGFGRREVEAAFHASLEAGLDFFDTAEVYGQGASETILGELEKESGARLTIASKFMPFPWRLKKRDFLSALRRSLDRLGRGQLELYQIHWPLPPVPIETWMEALAEAVEMGLVQAVGVSNYSLSQMERARSALARYGIRLRSNQVLYSLLDRGPEQSGLLEACTRQDIALIAYSPLAQGMLTGKYTLNNPPPFHRRLRVGRRRLANSESLVEVLRRIGDGHGGKSAAQVALNWVICMGAIPIPGAKDRSQAQENVGALDWRLTGEEMAALDRASQQL